MENRIVNVTLTVKQTEEAVEYWLTNTVLRNHQKVKEVTFSAKDEKFTVCFQADEVQP